MVRTHASRLTHVASSNRWRHMSACAEVAAWQRDTLRRLTEIAHVQVHRAAVSASDEVSDLVRGRVELFSIDTLVEMLTRLEILVTVRTKPVPKVA